MQGTRTPISHGKQGHLSRKMSEDLYIISHWGEDPYLAWGAQTPILLFLVIYSCFGCPLANVCIVNVNVFIIP